MPSIGERLAGRYRLDARIGSGGFATVFRARDLRLDRDVAVKVLLAHHATDSIVAARFEREARVLAAVSHPNVVAIHDVEPGDPSAGDEPFLVMDLCADGSLVDRLAMSPAGSLPPDALVPILVGVAAGLAALHARGIIHRDLKPSNILLSGTRAQIADLGIATTGPSDLTATGTAVGTLAYLAPEQLAGQPASTASDVHALGAIAFLGLTGRPPSPASSLSELVTASNRPMPRVSEAAPELDTAFDRPVAEALAIDPTRRPSAAAFGQMLAAAGARREDRPVVPVARLAAAIDGIRSGPGATDEPTTLVSIPVRRRRRGSPPAAGRWQGWIVVGLAAVIAILVLALLAAILGVGRGPGAAPSLGVVASASPLSSLAPTISPSPSPSPSPQPSPTPTPTVDPYAAAQSASNAMRATVNSSHGPNGLGGHDAKDLGNQLDQFDRALENSDPAMARDTANRVARQVADLVQRKGFDPELGAMLQAEADRLVATATALPD